MKVLANDTVKGNSTGSQQHALQEVEQFQLPLNLIAVLELSWWVELTCVVVGPTCIFHFHVVD
jgi:hypothetical protein